MTKRDRQYFIMCIFALASLLLVPTKAARAALGWVGNMYPAGGSTSEIAQGSTTEQTVYVQVYKAGVTEAAGQGGEINCYLHWGLQGETWATQPMAYNVDINNNDEYSGTIATAGLDIGAYGFTTYCEDASDSSTYWQSDGDGYLKISDPNQPSNASAMWVRADTIAWNTTHGPSDVTYRLHYDPQGDIDLQAGGGQFLTLAYAGDLSGNDYAKFPNVNGHKALQINGADLNKIPAILKGQIIIAAYDASDTLLASSGVQIQGALDDLYSYDGDLGVIYNGAAPSLHLWAPTAKSVTLQRFADASTPVSSTAAMTLNPTTGVWSITGQASWDRQYYRFDVAVFVPETGQVEHNLVSDPYAINLSTNAERCQFIDLYNDPALKPNGWDSLSKPALEAPEDITIYEVHVRDFSIQDASVTTESDRGTFRAFSYDGQNGRPLSNGMRHLQALQTAGLTHIHLLPVFDIASVNEDASARSEVSPTLLASYPPSSTLQQAAVGDNRADDAFNWGYDPQHYGVPEGSYSSEPDGTARITEFRTMVQTLNVNGLRVVMDVVYNHTSSHGQYDTSVLDKIVPGYYHRYTNDGDLHNSSCCADTASEFDMVEKLMVDTLLRWATAYKVDGFRFDLMNLHTVENTRVMRDAVRDLTLTADGVDGESIYLYGEGWDFGSASDKGLPYAHQWNMPGSGIGTFNDKIRDAAHGGYNTDALQIRQQGFINGLSYDWNGYLYEKRYQSDLRYAADRLRVTLAGSGQYFQFYDRGDNAQSGAGLDSTGYTLDPQETVNYVSKHDNETLYDQNVFKAPWGEGGTPQTSMADRVRMQNLGLSLVSFAQGIPFYQMGSDMLRSKSLDRNSYDSGDWFNKVDFSYQENNFGVGLPPAWDNQSRWSIMEPLLADATLKPDSDDILKSVNHLTETLMIRKSSPLFRLRSAAEINARVKFHNTGSGQTDALIVMSISDIITPDLDANYERIFVIFNANTMQQSFAIPALSGNGNISLHPVQAASSDPVVRSASFNNGDGSFSVPARSTAVFVDTSADSNSSGAQAPTWVGSMYPAEGSSNAVPQGDGRGLNVYAQTYRDGVTGTSNSSDGSAHECYLRWGRYGDLWQTLPMAFNLGFSDNTNNDEYFAMLPTLDLTPGTYGFTVYCIGAGNAAGDKTWRNGQDGILSITPSDDIATPGDPAGVFVHLFEWSWSDVEKECPALAEMGYSAVQVSPAQEHIVNDAWWARYQPVSYILQGRGGNTVTLQSMISTCNSVGIDVYADAVINHMSTGTGSGSAGSSYTSRDYPTVPYDTDNFNADCDINSYNNRGEVQNCRLLGLADIDHSNNDSLGKVQAYLNQLLGMGIKGLRVDGSKHIASYDLENVFAGLSESPYIFQEVIESYGEVVNGFEYFYNGDVTEFEYSNVLGNAFSGGSTCDGTLASLKTFGSAAGFMGTDFAVVFSDNHDNQRGHGSSNPCIVTHSDGEIYDLANVFMLAWPYGYPKVMSSYAFSDDDQGPPATAIYSGTTPSGCNGSDWVCEHRRPAIANMTAFRQSTHGEPVSLWWDNGSDQIAFGRGTKGYVAINREASALTRTFQTGMPAGEYCDVTKGSLSLDGRTCSGPRITVDEYGRIANHTLTALDAFALHAGAKINAQQQLYLPLTIKAYTSP